MHYILDSDNNPVAEPDVLAWAQWFGANTEQRIVERTELPGGVTVSTVFLGLDHGFGGRPLLYETMIFGGDEDGYMERFETLTEAVAGHQRAVGAAAPRQGKQIWRA